MKCKKCGAEVKTGHMYCSVCGNEVQLVPDYNLLDEDLLGDIIQHEARGGSREAAPKPDTVKRKAHRKKRVIWAASGTAAVVLVFTLSFLYQEVLRKQWNSYDYQYQKAEEAFLAGEYANAVSHFGRALELEEGDRNAKRRLAEVYLKIEEEAEAVPLLEELIAEDPSDQESIEELLGIYGQNREYDKISKLCEEVDGYSMPLLFGDYLVDSPVFGSEPGTYGQVVTVSMQAEEGCEILYTTDGEDPTLHGKAYEEEILLDEEGTTVSLAVARNQNGMFSKVAKASYTIRIEQPHTPSVSPAAGTYYEAQQITISAPEGCTAYYTWDGSSPTEHSAKYTGPLDMPPGNQVLSVVAVNAAGTRSRVYRVNYVYLP